MAKTAQQPTAPNESRISLRPISVEQLPRMTFAPPINPRLTRPGEVAAPWAYKRFSDLHAKDGFRARLLATLEEEIRASHPAQAHTVIQELKTLLSDISTHGAVVLADIVDSADFARLVERYDSIMEDKASASFIHEFADLRQSSEFLTDESINQPAFHPLLLVVIAHAIGGAIRVVDARAKNAGPISVLAQDNMLHIDNTPFNDEYKVLLTWRRGTTKGPAGQNFTLLPGTHKLARDCFLDQNGMPWSSENASIFTTEEAIEAAFSLQKEILEQPEPTVIEVTDPERPLTSVFASGSLIHHRFRTDHESERSSIIIAFHRASDNPGSLVSGDLSCGSRPCTFSRMITSGSIDSSYEERFLEKVAESAPAIVDRLWAWVRADRPASIRLESRRLHGARLQQWMGAATEAPRVEQVRRIRRPVPFGASMSEQEFRELIWGLMCFDKHGPLDMILYHDNHEEPRKWARNLIRESSVQRLFSRLLHWPLVQPTAADFLLPDQVQALIREVSSALSFDGALPEQWRDELAGMTYQEATRSVRQLLKDLAEAVMRCENLPNYVSTCLFAFWATDLAQELDGGRRDAVDDIARRLLRHYVIVSLAQGE